jgi:hypothetical protein
MPSQTTGSPSEGGVNGKQELSPCRGDWHRDNRGQLGCTVLGPGTDGRGERPGLEENGRAAAIVLTADDLAEIDSIAPPGVAAGTRYPIGQMHRVNL